MKKIFVLIFFTISSVTVATTYYVKNGGNDLADGKSDATAWRTLGKVSSASFAAGDSILFNKGDIWRETLVFSSSGTTANYITYGSYGTGNKPEILGSIKAVDWTIVNGNIWASATTVTDPYAVSGYESQVFFELPDGSVKWGHVKKSGTASLTTEYDWTWASNKVFIYSPTDPDEKYTSVEVPQRQNGIDLNDKQYITIDGLELHYQQNRGTYSDLNSKLSGLIIKNCKISYIGKKGGASHGISASYSDMLIQKNEIFEIGRRSISIYTYGSGYTIQNIIIENNTLYNGYHTTGIDISTGTTCSFNNITIRNNLIYDDVSKSGIAPEDYTSECIFLQNYGSGGTFNNVYIYDNLIKNTTLDGIHLENIQSSFIYNNTFYGVNPNRTNNTILVKYSSTCKNAVLRNNIFYSNGNSVVNSTAVCVYLSGTTDFREIKADYNLYYEADSRISIVVIGSSGSYKMSDWAALKSATGWEAHSPAPADPKFVSLTDFHLQAGSPAIGKGIPVAEVKVDFEGYPVRNPPDLGCFTTHSVVVPPVLPVLVSSVIENNFADLLIISYDLSLAKIIPPVSAFVIMANDNINIPVLAITIMDNTVKLTLGRKIKSNEKVTLSYTKPLSNSNTIQTPEGGEAASASLIAVTNRVVDISEPENPDIIIFDQNVKLYPNPANEYLNISFTESYLYPVILRAINSAGTVVFEEIIGAGIYSVRILLKCASGIYLIQFLSEGIKLGTKKLIVKQ